jgi:hypothetical protein
MACLVVGIVYGVLFGTIDWDLMILQISQQQARYTKVFLSMARRLMGTQVVWVIDVIESRIIVWSTLVAAVISLGVTAIGGMVMVGIMMRQFGICALIPC